MTPLQELAEIEKRHRTYSATWDDDWDMYKILVETHADRARLLALLRTARADALEEAAKLFDKYDEREGTGHAETIRSLMPKEG